MSLDMLGAVWDNNPKYWTKTDQGAAVERKDYDAFIRSRDAAAGGVAVHSCHANGMTLWHFLAIAVFLFVLFFIVQQVRVYWNWKRREPKIWQAIEGMVRDDLERTVR